MKTEITKVTHNGYRMIASYLEAGYVTVTDSNAVTVVLTDADWCDRVNKAIAAGAVASL